MIIDRYGRHFTNLRVSLTAACNYACTYCVPDGKKLQPANQELDAVDMLRAVELLVEGAGIQKLRITGGEPLLSPKFDEFLRGVTQLDLLDIAITTNGQFLPRKAPVIVESGLKRINISLDTLDHQAFRSIARSGDLKTVLQGIELMLEAGLRVKINMVPTNSTNIDQVLPLLEYCLERRIELRFIELMNMGHLKYNPAYEREFVSMDTLLEIIGSRYEFVSTKAAHDSTSVRYQIPGRGKFGIVANESEPFCSGCTRLRLSSNGYLYGCLSSTRRQSLRPLLSEPKHIALMSLQSLLRSAMADKQSIAFTGETTVMKFIGG